MQESRVHMPVAAEARPHRRPRPDIILWGSLIGVVAAYAVSLAGFADGALAVFTGSVVEFIDRMWWGVALGIVAVGLLSVVPREFVVAAIGRRSGMRGMMRAAVAGVLLDICNHGILMVSMKLYERGVATGKVMAFLIASPWNSLSLTFVMVALIGVGWTFAFIVLSMVIAVATGCVFSALERRGTLPSNPHHTELPEDFDFLREARHSLRGARLTLADAGAMAMTGVRDSRMVVRWLLFGVLLAAALRAFIPAEHFAAAFGPTVLGLMLTLAVGTVLEVCSEGTTPIAADIVVRAKAPGNGFTLLMAGVATDYTEIMVIRDTMRSWRPALFLPLITVPQVLVISWILNVSSL